MTWLQLIGAFLISLPFILATVLAVKMGGWKCAIVAWAVVIGLIACSFAGVHLLTNGACWQ